MLITLLNTATPVASKPVPGTLCQLELSFDFSNRQPLLVSREYARGAVHQVPSPIFARLALFLCP